MKKIFQFGFVALVGMLLTTHFVVRNSFADDAERKALDAKKSLRSAKRDVKKGVRKATGQDNVVDDIKDEASDAGKNIKDEVEYQKKK